MTQFKQIFTLSTFLGLAVVVSAGDRLTIDRGQRLLTENKDAGSQVPAVGEAITGLTFKDVAGKVYYQDDLQKRGPAVFVFLSSECPLAQAYGPRLARLRADFASRGVALFGVYANADETPEGVAEYAKKWKIEFPLVKDEHGYLARRLGATMTPQAFVIDRQGVLRYRGAIDDNRTPTLVKRHYLRDAITATLANRAVKEPQTDSPGCELYLPTAQLVKQVTYTGHIARVLQDHCTTCHRPGEVAPFALTSYEKARKYARAIDRYTRARIMPPWKAEPGFGAFSNERRLTEDELALIRRWVKDGSPRGEDRDLPPGPRHSSGWTLGKPDLVLEMPAEYRLAADGEDDYRHFVIPNPFDRDVYLDAVDVRPGNARIVHHVRVLADNSGAARKLDAADPGPGYTSFGGPGFKPVSSIGGWVPGRRPARMVRGTARWLPRGADIVLQVHYCRTGRVEKDRTRLALYLSREPRPVKVRSFWVLNRDFTIPAGAKRHEVRAQRTLKTAVYALGVFPHMHLLGKEIKVTATLPGGKVLPLVWVRDWDFNWQQGYRFKEPLLLPEGTRVEVVAYYDNSAGNPNNPHSPPKPVGWGKKTTDEMCIGRLAVVDASDYAPARGAR
jgi:mono/diheme cytochrome c family protein/peroxiredoxin